MAPRPVLVLAADSDFFPVEATVRTVERARRVFGLLGCTDNLQLVRTPGLHEYHTVFGRAATAFFAKHFGIQRELDERDTAPFDTSELRCTASGQVLVDRRDTRRVFDLNLAELRKHETGIGNSETAPQEVEWLHRVVHKHRQP